MTRSQQILALFEAKSDKDFIDMRGAPIHISGKEFPHKGTYSGDTPVAPNEGPFQVTRLNQPGYPVPRKGPVLGRPDSYMRRETEEPRYGSFAPMYNPKDVSPTHYPLSPEKKTAAEGPMVDTSKFQHVTDAEANIHRHHANRIAIAMKNKMTRGVAQDMLHNHVKAMGPDQRAAFSQHLGKSLRSIGFQDKAIRDTLGKHGL